MGYRQDLWTIASANHGVVTIANAEDEGVPAVEMRKLASRGALRRHGQGVYTHRDVPVTRFTEPAVAVALAGEGAFLEREAVFDLLGIGQFNPPQVRVGTVRRVRRTLPTWMSLEYRTDIDADDLTEYEGIPATSSLRALHDLQGRIPPDRWDALARELIARDLVDPAEVSS